MLRRSSAASGNSVIKKCLILKLTSFSLPCLLRGKMSSYDKNRATACNASATEDVENDSRECVFAMLSCNNCSNRAMIHHVFQDPKFVLRPGVSEQHLSLHLSLSFSLSLFWFHDFPPLSPQPFQILHLKNILTFLVKICSYLVILYTGSFNA